MSDRFAALFRMLVQVIGIVTACLRVPVDDVESSSQGARQPAFGQKPGHDEDGCHQHAMQCKYGLDVEEYCTLLNVTGEKNS